MKKAVILVSGGLDSATCLALAKKQGYDCYAISFAYGQRHSAELAAAKRVVASIGVKDHKIMQLDTSIFSNSALTNAAIAIPDYQESLEIPVTYVPARNIIFLSMALAYAESIAAQSIFIGVSSIDYSHYPDCRPEFLQAFQIMANLGTKTAVEGQPIELIAPLQHLSKCETVQLGTELGVEYSLTCSCYQANDNGEACGVCDSCTFRKKGFQAAGVADPTRYQSEVI